MKRANFISVLLFITLIGLVSCVSRYRLDLYITADETREKAKVETTEFVKDAALGNFDSERKIKAGDFNVAIVTSSLRGQRVKLNTEYALSFDENLRIMLYLQFPKEISEGEIDLVGNSCAQLLGRYDWSPKQKLFMPQSGMVRVDSVKAEYLFSTVDGEFKNADGKSCRFDGQFRIKIRD